MSAELSKSINKQLQAFYLKFGILNALHESREFTIDAKNLYRSLKEKYGLIKECYHTYVRDGRTIIRVTIPIIEKATDKFTADMEKSGYAVDRILCREKSGTMEYEVIEFAEGNKESDH